MTSRIPPVFLLISVSLFLATTQAQDCNNPLLNTFSLSGLSEPQSAASLPYCTSLQAGQTCCSNSTVSSLQTALNNLTARLQSAASSRDLYITELRDQYLNQFQQLEDGLDDLSDEITNLQTANATIGNEVAIQRDLLHTISEELSDIEDNFQSSLEEYQRTRVNCFNTFLKVQASAWCLACDPDYASKGVLENGTISFSGDLCTTISEGCYPFLEAGAQQNPLFRARQAFERLQNIISYVNEFVSSGVIPNRTLDGDIETSTNSTERTVAFPAGCNDNDNCPWQCQNLFSEGVMDEEIVANGAGLIGGDDVDFASIGETSSRLLQNTVTDWNPDLEATGFTYNVAADPANVTGLVGDGSVVIPGSGLNLKVGGAVIGLIMLFIQIIF